MESIKLPNQYDVEELAANKAKISFSPMLPGYGITLGNALRRVLLSSINGSAITAVKIKGVDHEFSTLEDVAEDAVDIILNLKKVRVKTESEEPIKIKLLAKGEKIVTAADVEKNPEIEILNPSQQICTLTSAKAEFEAELTINQGMGYEPVEARVEGKEGKEIGVINIDAIYTPVKNVNFNVENIRVGEMTNWNKLVLDIETDGSVSPAEAVKKAALILVDHFLVIAEPTKMEKEEEPVETTEAVEVKEAELPEKSITVEEGEATPEEKEEEPKKKRGRPKKNQE